MIEPKPLSMNSSEDREALRGALEWDGVPTLDSELGGGMKALEIVLVADNGWEALSILVGSWDAQCEVGLSGFRTRGEKLVDCASAETLRPDTLSQAVGTVKFFWHGRMRLVRDFDAGRYDLN